MAINQLAVLWLGTLALLLTFSGLLLSVRRYRQGEASLEGLIAFAFGLAFWGAFAIHSLGYQLVTDAGVVITRASTSLALLGLLGAGATFVLLLEGAMRAIQAN